MTDPHRDAPTPPEAPPHGPAEPFSVLMPLWGKDRPDRVEQAIRSATEAQQLRPDLLVLTVDGPLPEPLDALVARVEAEEFGPATVLRHDDHRGVASALCKELEKTVRGDIYADVSKTALPFFLARGYEIITPQQVNRRGVKIGNFACVKRRT